MTLPRTRTQWIVLTTVIALFGALWIGATRVQPGQENPNGRPPSPDVGHPAPDFTLTRLDGGELSLSDLKGTPVIVNFWATWCGPCRAEIPALEAAQQRLGDDAIILGVNVQEDPARVLDFAAELNMTYPIVLDETAATSQLYQVRAFPTTYFIDARGVIVDVYTGPLNEPLLRQRADELAAGG
jgi:thiol-disulfide isomerase/thioredoxin